MILQKSVEIVSEVVVIVTGTWERGVIVSSDRVGYRVNMITTSGEPVIYPCLKYPLRIYVMIFDHFTYVPSGKCITHMKFRHLVKSLGKLKKY